MDAPLVRDLGFRPLPDVWAKMQAFTAERAGVVAREVRSLARWLGLRNIAYDQVPRGWRKALDG